MSEIKGLKIPDYYKDSIERYFSDVLLFLEEYKWLYDFKVTDIFIENVIDMIPEDWKAFYSSLDTDGLNNLPYATQQDEIPSSLWQFISSSQKLSFYRQKATPYSNENEVKLTSCTARGMNPKKQHEVVQFAEFIASICQKYKNSIVVDVGSGLGYLGYILHNTFSYPVIGLENKITISHSADIRAKKQDFDSSSLQNIYFELKDEENSFAEFDSMISGKLDEYENDFLLKTIDSSEDSHHEESPSTTLSNVFPSNEEKICLVGLHCCGNLTPTMLKLTARSEKIRTLICVSCCYHKMSFKDGKYELFPLSQYFTSGFDSNEFSISGYGLRLGAQETRARWCLQTSSDHEYHTKNVAYRGILEKYLNTEAVNFDKKTRNISNKKDMKSFESYIDALDKRTNIIKDFPGSAVKLNDLYEEFKEHFKYIELITLAPPLPLLIDVLSKMQYTK